MNKIRNIIIFIVLSIGLSVAYVFSDSVSIDDIKGQVHGGITDALARSHQAQLFRTGNLFTSLASGTSATILIDISTESFTGDQINWNLTVAPSGESFVRIYKNPTIVSSGTLMSSYSVNDSTDATGVEALFYYSGNFSSSGTAISPQYIVSTGTVFNEGDLINNGAQRVGFPATEYLIEIINQDTGAINVGGYIDYYEVD